MDNIKVEKITLEDGRRAERRVKENENEVVLELLVEPERPLHLSKRVIEKKKPFVYERQTETINASGEVVEVKKESAEPQVEMQVVNHIGVADNTRSQNGITREEMEQAIAYAIQNSRHDNSEEFNAQSTPASEENKSWVDVGIMIIIAAEALGLGYMIFWM